MKRSEILSIEPSGNMFKLRMRSRDVFIANASQLFDILLSGKLLKYETEGEYPEASLSHVYALEEINNE